MPLGTLRVFIDNPDGRPVDAVPADGKKVPVQKEQTETRQKIESKLNLLSFNDLIAQIRNGALDQFIKEALGKDNMPAMLTLVRAWLPKAFVSVWSKRDIRLPNQESSRATAGVFLTALQVFLEEDGRPPKGFPFVQISCKKFLQDFVEKLIKAGY